MPLCWAALRCACWGCRARWTTCWRVSGEPLLRCACWRGIITRTDSATMACFPCHAGVGKAAKGSNGALSVPETPSSLEGHPGATPAEQLAAAAAKNP